MFAASLVVNLVLLVVCLRQRARRLKTVSLLLQLEREANMVAAETRRATHKHGAAVDLAAATAAADRLWATLFRHIRPREWVEIEWDDFTADGPARTPLARLMSALAHRIATLSVGGAVRCLSSGPAVRVECPRCGRVAPSVARFCARCRFKVGSGASGLCLARHEGYPKTLRRPARDNGGGMN